MIPKKIHYCWFGNNPLPEIALKCMESWKQFCPDYEIIRWDESNCDMAVNQFVEQAYQEKKWAFVSDYFRLKVVEEQGGIYLDIDVELLKPLDDLLELDGFMGFELGQSNSIATGLGFGAVACHPIITALRENYEKTPFINPDGSLDTLPCPQRDTKVLVGYGLVQNNQKQTIHGITFFPSDYFSPISHMGEELFTDNTYSVHHFNASWYTEEKKKMIDSQRKLIQIFGSYWGRKLGAFAILIHEVRNNGVRSACTKIKNKFFIL